MSLTVNVNAVAIQRALSASSAASAESQNKMATGKRINSAKDDAAGLAIATRMQTRSQGITVAQRNVNDGLSMAQTADSALSQVSDIMTRMKELATQAANGTNGTGDNANLDAEYQQLAQEVTRTLTNAGYNGLKIMGADAGARDFQIGADSSDTFTVTTTDFTANTNVTAVTGGDLTDATNAKAAMDDISAALDDVNAERAMYGAVQSRFESISNGLQSESAALNDATSRITDVDYASEMSKLQSNQVLQQAAASMLAQANSRPQTVLTLLRG